MRETTVFAFVKEFMANARKAVNQIELFDLLNVATKEIDFAHFAIVEHRNIASNKGFIELTNYPADWHSIFVAQEYFRDDPIVTASNSSVAPFCWSEIDTVIELNTRQRDILRRSVDIGLINGVTVPLHMAGRLPASANFVSTQFSVPEWKRTAAHSLGLWGFEAARRLFETKSQSCPRLSDRQAGCLIMIARGHSDWTAGKLLGISERTVREHIDNIKKLYGVASRPQLITRALYDGQISFADTLFDRLTDRFPTAMN